MKAEDINDGCDLHGILRQDLTEPLPPVYGSWPIRFQRGPCDGAMGYLEPDLDPEQFIDLEDCPEEQYRFHQNTYHWNLRP